MLAMYKLAAVLSSLACAAAGVYLLQTQAVEEGSWLETIAHGMGIYFIGKAFFVGPMLWLQARQLDAQGWVAKNTPALYASRAEQPASPQL